MVRHRWRIIYKFGGAALDTVAVLQRLPFSQTNDQMASLSSESLRDHHHQCQNRKRGTTARFLQLPAPSNLFYPSTSQVHLEWCLISLKDQYSPVSMIQGAL